MRRMDEIILFGIGYLGGVGGIQDKIEMAEALGISVKTLNRYLNGLFKADLISKVKESGTDYKFALTERGKKRYAPLLDTFLDTYLTPEQHKVSRMVPLRPYLEFIDDPFNGFEIIAKTHLQKQFNISEIFKKDAVLRKESRYLAQIKEGLSIESEGSPMSVDDIIQAYTMLGIKQEEVKDRMLDSDRIWSTLSRAEYLLRAGSLEGAMDLYKHILSTKEGLPSNTWIITYSRYLK